MAASAERALTQRDLNRALLARQTLARARRATLPGREEGLDLLVRDT